MKTHFLFITLFISALCFAQQDSLPTITKPETVGMSTEGLNKIRPLMQKYVDDNKLPGMVTIAARHGKAVFFESYGVMYKNKPMQKDAIFRIASMTKPVTSVAVMILFDEGRLKLDDPVSMYIPEFGNLKVLSSIDKDGVHLLPQNRPMTIRNLLMHTSGLASGGGDSPIDSIYKAANLSAGTLKDMIQKLADIPLLYQPGTRWNYSRSSDVLAYLVEVVSGKRFDVFLKERIFDPLGMKDCGYSIPLEKLDRATSVYSPGDSTGIKTVMEHDADYSSTPVKFFAGNGGLVATAADYMTFAQMLLNKGEYNGRRILKTKTVELMTSNHITSEIMPDDDFFGSLLAGMGFGFGMAVLNDNSKTNNIGSAGSYWWSGSANTYFYVDPREDLVLIFMTQFVPNFYYPVFKEFRELTYKSIIK